VTQGPSPEPRRSGAALTAPAYEPVAKFPVRIENGVIQVRDDRWD